MEDEKLHYKPVLLGMLEEFFNDKEYTKGDIVISECSRYVVKYSIYGEEGEIHRLPPVEGDSHCHIVTYRGQIHHYYVDDSVRSIADSIIAAFVDSLGDF